MVPMKVLESAHEGVRILTGILLVVSVTATSNYQQSLQLRDLNRESKRKENFLFKLPEMGSDKGY